MTDPLAPYRKATAVPRSPVPSLTGREKYLAFEARDSVKRLDIRRANDLTYAPKYELLSDVSHDGSYGTSVVLTFNFLMIVFVEGKNLQAVIAAIKSDMAIFIQEFDAAKWDKPQDPKEPIIESINVVMLDGEGTENEKPFNSTKH